MPAAAGSGLGAGSGATAGGASGTTGVVAGGWGSTGGEGAAGSEGGVDDFLGAVELGTATVVVEPPGFATVVSLGA
ncbi:MAG TPA: hypothetical protein DEG43_01600 [Acidimicrobiaceae bacterium]|nr:hypothetical protein [Acidimicrobiaceae bacterium]